MIKASIILPTLNEQDQVSMRLQALQPLRKQGVELILVDGGSQDDTWTLAEGKVDQRIMTSPGRALQMNAGARVAQGQWLCFLHIDTRLTPLAEAALIRHMQQSVPGWGRFDVRIEGQHPLLVVVAGMMNLRSRWSGIATGDQLIFVHRQLFDAVGGFPQQPLMEDVELSKRLKQLMKPCCLSESVITSGRRWDTRGFWSTVWLMWSLRWRYWRGVSAETLVKEYYP
ncbi:MAG: TIGR04283 family arsenosugar biosynthesis glycosyltransferase [Nitrincola lacisaponensis]|uniref:TIGR04283 family arsenosugar biosynthesis glycosyltransferase n=1 Tax=Nitrincola lacisaponensis TaxID=267850 RepID=UPI00391B48FB